METPRYRIIFSAKGHGNITARHKSTVELTKENYLTKRGTCIIGIKSQLCCEEIPVEIKKYLKEEARVVIRLKVGGISDTIECMGQKGLILGSDTSIVIRKSEYIDDRTIAVRANKAAADIRRDLINELKKGHRLIVIIDIY